MFGFFTTLLDGMSDSEHPDPRTEAPRSFETTRWSIVRNSASQDSREASEALGKLCQTYWAPVNAYIRRTGYGVADAEDLTQQFFARFLQKGHYRQAERARGRFRNFLLMSLKHFLINEWER